MDELCFNMKFEAIELISYMYRKGMYVIGKMYFICEITDKSPNLSITEYYNIMRLN